MSLPTVSKNIADVDSDTLSVSFSMWLISNLTSSNCRVSQESTFDDRI